MSLLEDTSIRETTEGSAWLQEFWRVTIRRISSGARRRLAESPFSDFFCCFLLMINSFLLALILLRLMSFRLTSMIVDLAALNSSN